MTNSQFSALVARHCGAGHHVVDVPPATVLARLDETMALLANPNGDPLTVPNLMLFERAAECADVMLNGEGGDPCFGGPKNLPMILAELMGPGMYEGSGNAWARESSFLRAHEKCYDDLGVMLEADALAAIAERPLERELAPLLGDPTRTGLVDTLMAINVRWKGAFHILPKVDALAAPFGIAPRSPLFDRQVVEQAFTIPARLKLRGAEEKYLLKRAVRDLLPPAILERPKSGMLVPVEAWFRGPLREAARERLLDGLAAHHLVRRGYMESLFEAGRGVLHPRRGIRIWLLLALESWLRMAR